MDGRQGSTSTAHGTSVGLTPDPFAPPPEAGTRDGARPRWSWRKRVLVTLAVTATVGVTAVVFTVGVVVMWSIVPDIVLALLGCFAPYCD